MFKAFSSVVQSKISASPLLRGAVSSLQIEAANQVLSEMFGEEIQSSAQAMFIKQGVITVACMHAPMAQELRLREQEFIRRLKEKPYADRGIDRVSYLLDELV